MNFRRTTTKVNSLNTFKAWQKERKERDLKKLNRYYDKIKVLVGKEIIFEDIAKIFDVSVVVVAEYLRNLNN